MKYIVAMALMVLASGCASTVVEAEDEGEAVAEISGVNGAPEGPGDHCVLDSDCSDASPAPNCASWACSVGAGDGYSNVPAGCMLHYVAPGAACPSGSGLCAYLSQTATASRHSLVGICIP